jgi:hypothetical protein
MNRAMSDPERYRIIETLRRDRRRLETQARQFLNANDAERFDIAVEMIKQINLRIGELRK